MKEEEDPLSKYAFFAGETAIKKPSIFESYTRRSRPMMNYWGAGRHGNRSARSNHLTTGLRSLVGLKDWVIGEIWNRMGLVYSWSHHPILSFFPPSTPSLSIYPIWQPRHSLSLCVFMRLCARPSHRMTGRECLELGLYSLWESKVFRCKTQEPRLEECTVVPFGSISIRSRAKPNANGETHSPWGRIDCWRL